MNQISGLERRTRLRELAALFLKLGFIGFGGPAAHIAMMQDEVVHRREWLTAEEFLDLLGATNLIPGPNSTEMAIHIGRLRAGTPGLIVAGLCFILPAVLLVMGCGWLYVKYGSLPETAAFTYGVKPVIIAIVAHALWALGRSAIQTPILAGIAIGAVGAAFAAVHELVVLALAAVIATVIPRENVTSLVSGSLPYPYAVDLPRPTTAVVIATGAASATSFGTWPLFWFFLKVGSVLFGSGYVLLAFIRADLVERWHWLSESQLLDAIAVGQFTPGPVFTTATFIGYILGGVPASIAATVGIFLPAFFFVAVSAPFIPRLRRSPLAARFLDGLNVGSLALMAVVTWYLAVASVRDFAPVTIALAAAVALYFRVNSAWLVFGGAIAGLVLQHYSA